MMPENRVVKITIEYSNGLIEGLPVTGPISSGVTS
jgi:hypothetical protein